MNGRTDERTDRSVMRFCNAKAKNWYFSVLIISLSYAPTFAEAKDDVEGKTKRFGWRYHVENADEDTYWFNYNT